MPTSRLVPQKGSTAMHDDDLRSREPVEVTVISVPSSRGHRARAWLVGAALLGAVFVFASAARSTLGTDDYVEVKTATTVRSAEERDEASSSTTSSTTSTTVPVTTTTVYFVAVPEMNLPPEFVPVPEMSAPTTTAKPATRSSRRSSGQSFVPVPEGLGKPFVPLPEGFDRPATSAAPSTSSPATTAPEPTSPPTTAAPDPEPEPNDG